MKFNIQLNGLKIYLLIFNSRTLHRELISDLDLYGRNLSTKALLIQSQAIILSMFCQCRRSYNTRILINKQHQFCSSEK